MSEELERCPFCRSSIVGAHVNDFHLHEVGCGACGCSGPAEASEAEAIAAWNRRAPAQPEPAAPTFTQEQFDEAEAKGKALSERLKAQDAAWPEAAPTVVEPVGWLEAPYGGYKQNPRYRLTLPPAALAWKIPLYTTPPRAALTDEELIGRAKARGIHDADAAICFGRAVEAALGHETNCMTKAREIEALRNSLAECVEDSEEVLATHLQAYGEKYRVQRADFLRAQISTARALLAGKAVTP